MTTTAKTPVTCYGEPVRGSDWQQEWYETASRHAGRRARQLRKLGLRVGVEGMGEQVTDVGRVRMTLLSIHYIPDGFDVPRPERVVTR